MLRRATALKRICDRQRVQNAISGKFDKYFTFMLLALCDGTTAQLQICSSERNVPLLPVDWRKYN